MPEAPLYAPRLNRAIWKVENLDRYVKEASQVLAKLDRKALRDLLRRAASPSTPTGFPGSSYGAPGGGSSDTTSTERAALHGLPEALDDESQGPADDWSLHEVADLLRSNLDELCGAIVEIAGLAAIIEKKRAVIAEDALRRKESGGPGICATCGREVKRTAADPWPKGFCKKCYKAWWRRDDRFRTDDPGSDRAHFVAWRTEQLEISAQEAENERALATLT